MTPTGAPLRVLVVDDEPATRRYIGDLIGRNDALVLVGECESGREAVSILQSAPVDLVFLDVALPDLDGFAVISEVGLSSMPAVVFVSAFAEYAVRAFEAYALDYLLKPIDPTRFQEAVRRAQTRVERSTPDAATDVRMAALLSHLESRGLTRYPEAMAIRAGGSYSVVRVADIDWIEADGNYAKI